MKAAIKNLTHGPREARGVEGPIIIGAYESETADFDDLWLQSARQAQYFEISEKRGPGRPPKDAQEVNTSSERVQKSAETEQVK